jgi:hypothetical protein
LKFAYKDGKANYSDLKGYHRYCCSQGIEAVNRSTYIIFYFFWMCWPAMAL